MFRMVLRTEKNTLISVENTDLPYGIKLERYEEVTPGLFVARITYGYMEVPDLPALF